MAPEFDIPRNWRLRKQRYSLVGEVCPTCEEKLFPPRDVCPHCGGHTKQEYQFSGKGEVYSFTTVYDAPSEYTGLVPYKVALIKLEEGPVITAQLTDLGKDEVYIGMPVEMVTRRLQHNSLNDRGPIPYGYKFRPLLDSIPKEDGHRVVRPSDNSGLIYTAED